MSHTGALETQTWAGAGGGGLRYTGDHSSTVGMEGGGMGYGLVSVSLQTPPPAFMLWHAPIPAPLSIPSQDDYSLMVIIPSAQLPLWYHF